MKRILMCIACVLLLAVVALAQNPTQQTVVTLAPGTHTVTIPISDQTPGITSYLWVRSSMPGGEDWASPQTLPGTASQIVDANVPGGTWYYEAKAVLGSDQSTGSNEVNAAVPQPPSAPLLGTPVVN